MKCPHCNQELDEQPNLTKIINKVVNLRDESFHRNGKFDPKQIFFLHAKVRKMDRQELVLYLDTFYGAILHDNDTVTDKYEKQTWRQL